MLVSYRSKTEWSPIRSVIIRVHIEFTQQDGRKKRTTKRLSVTNVSGLLLSRFVVIFNYITKLFVTRVTHGLPSYSLSRPVA